MSESKVINVGDIITGRVTSIKPYGAFLLFDNGMSGLLHISEISEKYVYDITYFAPLNAKLKVKVVGIDTANNFLRLSLKQLPDNVKINQRRRLNKEKVDPALIDFSGLEKALPCFIEMGLNQAKESRKDD